MTCTSISASMTHASAFEKALAQYLTARNNLNDAPAEPSAAGEDVASAAYYHSEERMPREPVESLADFRAKFDCLFLDPASIAGPDVLLQLFADLRRLTDGARSELFEPARWLAFFEKKGGMYCVRGEEVFLLTPTGANLSDLMFELEASGGRDDVNALLLQRCSAEAA